MQHHPNFPNSLHINPNPVTCHNVINFADRYSTSQQTNDIQSFGIAGRVWEASFYLANYLQNPLAWDPPCSLIRSPPSRTVMELGSGSGFVANLLLDLLRSTNSCGHPDLLILTDLDDVCTLLRKNVHPDSIDLRIRPLNWGDVAAATNLIADELGDRHLSHIVCCDLVYFPELLAPLLRTLLALTTGSPVQVILATKIRSLAKESPFWYAFGMWFDFEPVNPSLRNHFARDDDVYLFVAQRKPQSFSWKIPQSDGVLLEGVGLDTTGAEKFEWLLLSNLS